ncbi:MAG: DUF4388 domain-containing protein [Sandaracinaceae bacterium]|nr:DUF4388 domain-containing protein [Sandaracinaceae bacterium]
MTRVLVVLADPEASARVVAALAALGLDVRAVTSGERAMDRFIQEPSDVVVVDYDLEGRDGVTTAEAIRWMPGGRRARVVLTATHEPDDGPLAALGESVDAFAALVGPLDLAALGAVVARAAAVEPHTAETRVLSTEHALLEVERRRSSSGSIPAPPEATPSEARTDEDSTQDEPVSASSEWRDTDGRVEGRAVRALAEEFDGEVAALSGRFADTSFARVLHWTAEHRATGALVCVHPPDRRQTTEGSEPTKVVYFRAGVPVHVESNVLGECLGQVLARMRKIGPVALRESLEAVRRGEGRQGEVLVEMGAIQPLELSEALAHQMRLKLFELFAWRDGTFRFAPDRDAPPDVIDLELGLAEIVYRGLAATQDPREVRAALEASAERFAIPRARKLVRFLPLADERGLRTVIQRADGTRTIGELLAGSSDPGRAAILLYAMHCLDALELSTEPLRARARPAATLPSVPSAAPTLPSSSAIAIPLDPAASEPPPARVEDADSDGTRVAPHRVDAHARDDGPAPPAERDLDATTVGSRPEPSRPRPYSPAIPPSFRASPPSDAPEMERARDTTPPVAARELDATTVGPRPHAPAAPSSDSRRAREIARAATRELDALRAAAPATAEDDAARLVVTRALEAPARRAAPDAHGAPDPNGAPLAPEAPDAPEAVARDDEPTPAPPARAELTLASSSAAVEAPPERDATGSGLRARPSGELDERVERLLKAERRFRRGQRALAKAQFDQAIAAFEEAASLCPEEGHFAVHLAWARHAADPEDALLLERCVLDAERGRRRAPELADAHALTARLLVAAGRLDEAREAYARALALEPDHADAHRELAAIARR